MKVLICFLSFLITVNAQPLINFFSSGGISTNTLSVSNNIDSDFEFRADKEITGTTYYVSQWGGGDTLQTIDDVNGLTLSAGDGVLFNRGGEWNDDSLRINFSGDASNYIVIGAYGSGDRPIFNLEDSFDTGILIVSKNYIEIRDIYIKNASVSGVDITGTSSNIILSRVQADSTGNQGFQNQGDVSVTMYDVAAYGNADDGVSGHDTCDITIYNGTFNGNDQGINIINGVTLIAYNTQCLDNTTNSYFITNDANGVTAYFYGAESNSQILVTNSASATFYGLYQHDYTADFCIDTDGSTNADNLYVYHSIFEELGANKFGIAIRAGVNFEIKNCVFYDSDQDGKGIYTASDGAVYNNIFQNLAVGIHDATTTIYDSASCYYNNTADYANDVTPVDTINADPEIISVGSDYRIASTSPCVNSGVSNGLTKDYYNAEYVGTVDVGAIEYGGIGKVTNCNWGWLTSGNHSFDSTSTSLAGDFSGIITATGAGDGDNYVVLGSEYFTSLGNGDSTHISFEALASTAGVNVTMVIGGQNKTWTGVDNSSGETLEWTFLTSSSEIGEDIIIYLNKSASLTIDGF